MATELVPLLELLANQTSVGLLVTSAEGAPVWNNRALADLTGADSEHPVDDELVSFLRDRAGGDDAERPWVRPDGTRRWFDVTRRPLPADDQRLELFQIVDVTDRYEREQAARRRERRLFRIEEAARLGTWEWDLATDAVLWSDELLKTFGYPPGKQLDYYEYRSLVHPDDIYMIEESLEVAVKKVEPFTYTHRMYLADRITERVFVCYGEVLPDESGQAARVVGAVQDVTEQRRAQEELAYLAERDPLTSLPNRRSLFNQLRERYDRGVDTGVLLLVDIDDFRLVNDTYGPLVGDQVLSSLAPVLLAHADPRALVARLGGDEFAIVLPEVETEAALATARAMCASVAGHTFDSDGTAVRTTVTIGVAPLRSADEPEGLLAEADLAVRSARTEGRGNAQIVPGTPRAVAERLTVPQRVRLALDRDLFALDAQAIVDLGTRSVVSYELLLRLRDKLKPDLETEDLIQGVERTDLMLEVDRWVAEQAVAALGSTGGRRRGLRLEINVSVRSLSHPEFADHLLTLLREAGVEPERLGLEITETAAIASPDSARHQAERLAGVGCRFILDDFSAGLGSFVHLKQLPFTAVKIAGSFLRQATWTVTDAVLVESVVDAARALGMRTIAKQVDREFLIRALERLGVQRGQGFELARPVPLTRLVTP